MLAGMASVDTRAVRDRRELRFETAADVRRDVERLLGSERAGTLRRTGNWTLGQALGHLAAWASYPFDGYPPDMRPPWPVRFAARLLRKRVLGGALPAGYRIPRVPGGTWAVDDIPAAEGADRCIGAFERLEREAPTGPNPVFGPLTHEEWMRLNLGHAELHLSFFHPDASAEAGR